MLPCGIKQHKEDYQIYGLINFDTVSELYKKGIELLELSSSVRLDFAAVTQVDSSSIALLLNWLRIAKQKQKNLLFVNLPNQLLEIANVCEVMSFLKPYIT